MILHLKDYCQYQNINSGLKDHDDKLLSEFNAKFSSYSSHPGNVLHLHGLFHTLA